MTDSSHGNHLFDESVQHIHDKLFPVHLTNFQHNASASTLLDELRAFATNSGASDTGIILNCRRFALFLRTFAPYFDVLSICILVKHEWMGWFFGLFNQILKTSCENHLLMEKVASIFEAVAHILPRYHQIHETCRRNAPSPESDPENYNLAILMSWAYADMVRLCLDVHSIIHRIDQGHASQHTNHKLAEGQWRPLDSRFARLEARLAQHRKWLDKETRNHIQPYAEIAHHRNQYFNFLHGQTEGTNSNKITEDGKLEKRSRRVARLTTWLRGQLPLNKISGSITTPFAQSCDWFMVNPMYRHWKDSTFEINEANDKNVLANTWQHRVLFVQAANEGFGKTVLAQAVLDELAINAEDPEAHGIPSTIAFFRFDIEDSRNCSAEAAFRAIAIQLIESHRHDRATLDLVCLLSRRTSLRSYATVEEVIDTTSLLVQQHPTYLVIDGINDCVDLEFFLKGLARVCRTSDARAILFSTPNIRIPLEYQKWASDAPHILILIEEHSAVAIESFIVQPLDSMADRGYFGTALDRELLPQVARASEGNYLWATLTLKFLESSLLTAEERCMMLENIQTLAGLDSLYANILGALERLQKQDKAKISGAFRWLSFSVRTLEPRALRCVLGVHDNVSSPQPSTSGQLQALSGLSCGLLSSKNDTIAFVHPSLRRYLQSTASSHSELSLSDETTAHAHLATECLSYLAHTMPKQPLGPLRPPSPLLPATTTADSGASMRTSKSGDSGYKSLSSSDGDNHHHHHHPDIPPLPTPPTESSSTNNPNSPPFDTHLPFLRYASLCWPIHLSRALAPHHHPIPTHPTYPFLPALHAFLSSRLAVTAWVEASFRYNLPPTLTRLVGPLSDLKGEIPPTTHTGRELRAVVRLLREVSEQCVELKREWEGAVRGNAGLVWMMDRVRGGREEFWVVWEDGGGGMVG